MDPYNQYSRAYFDNTEISNDAQIKKLDLICKKINVSQNDRVLDIGCDWGGLAGYMAQQFGCKVTAINIADAQISYAHNFYRSLPVNVVSCDYHDIKGKFDKIISMGMFENVGQKNYPAFMKTAHRCLKDNGIFLLHKIGENHSTIKCDPWITKYIFPNGMLPSIAQISKAVSE